MVQGMVVGKGFSESSPFDKEWKPTIANTDLMKLNSFYIVKKKRGVQKRKETKENNKEQFSEEPHKMGEGARESWQRISSQNIHKTPQKQIQVNKWTSLRMNNGSKQRVPDRKCKNKSDIPQNMFIILTFKVYLTPVRMASISKTTSCQLDT